MTLAEVHVKWSVILMDLLGANIFSTLGMKGQILHRGRAHLKVPGWSLVWNELLTKKLPMFLSRLNEISGGWEKIVPISEPFWSNLIFFKDDRFNCVVMRGKCESEWNAVTVPHKLIDSQHYKRLRRKTLTTFYSTTQLNLYGGQFTFSTQLLTLNTC